MASERPQFLERPHGIYAKHGLPTEFEHPQAACEGRGQSALMSAGKA